MIENRVRQLRLKVSAPAGREPSARALADRFTRDVLDRFCNILEARAPGRVTLIRELNLRWSYTEMELADPAQADRCAAELAESIETQSNGSGPQPGAAGDVVVFADEPAWLAAFLKSQADGHAHAWFHASLRGEGLSARLKADGGRDTALASLLRLERSGDLLPIIERLSPQIILPLFTALDLKGIESRGAATDHTQEDDADHPYCAATRASARDQVLFEITRSLPPTLSSEAAAIALYVKLLARTNDIATAAELSPRAARSRETMLPSALVDRPTTPNSNGPRAIPGVARPEGDAAVAMPALSADVPASWITQYGGLFYLLSLALELGIGEMLWKACLPEGLILAHAAAAILGPAGASDPAPLFFGGVTDEEMREFPAVSAEQHAEVSTEVLASLAAALPRRGLAEYPEVYLDIVETPTGRIVAACPPGAFAIYAQPAPDARSAADAIAGFLKHWPRSAPTPRARPVLASLDPTIRLRPDPAPRGHVERLIPLRSSSSSTALLAQICGSLGCLFTARAMATDEQSPTSAETFVSRFLSISGKIVVEPERLTIALPMYSVDVALRISGLDRDPGWVEWLNQTVRIEFEPRGGEEML